MTHISQNQRESQERVYVIVVTHAIMVRTTVIDTRHHSK